MNARSSSCSCSCQTAISWNNIGVDCLQQSKYCQAASSFNSALVLLSKAFGHEQDRQVHESCGSCRSALIIPSGIGITSFTRRYPRSCRSDLPALIPEESASIFRHAFYFELEQTAMNTSDAESCLLELLCGTIILNAAIAHHLISLRSLSEKVLEKNRSVSRTLYKAAVEALLSLATDLDGQPFLRNDRNCFLYRFAVMAALNNALAVAGSDSQQEVFELTGKMFEFSCASLVPWDKVQGIDEQTMDACREWEDIFRANAEQTQLKHLGILYDAYTAAAA